MLAGNVRIPVLEPMAAPACAPERPMLCKAVHPRVTPELEYLQAKWAAQRPGVLARQHRATTVASQWVSIADAHCHLPVQRALPTLEHRAINRFLHQRVCELKFVAVGPNQLRLHKRWLIVPIGEQVLDEALPPDASLAPPGLS
jgi:hypothetical protein